MGWESKVFNQMLSCSCIFKNTPSWMALVALLMLFSSYLLVGLGYFSILYTCLVVVFSTVFYTVSKHKAVEVDDELVEDMVLKPEEECSDQRGKIIAPTPLHEHKKERAKEAKEAEEEDARKGAADANYSVTSSPDLISESEFQDQLSTSVDSSEVDWPIRYVVDHSPDDECSDGSISDEESLIEIALPSGHYVSQQQQKDEPRYNCSLQQRKRELSAETLFSHQSLMDFLSSELNDVNEEENLIEIDISIGSIKYSRFEIEA